MKQEQTMDEFTQLHNLLAEPINLAIEREQAAFDRLTSPFHNSLVLFGAGGLGRKTLAGLRHIGIEPMAFADNNPRLWGTQIAGVPVFGPQDAAEQFGRSSTFVVTIWHAGGNHRFAQTRNQLLALGCSKVASFAYLFWKYADTFLPYYAIGLPHLLLPQAEQINQAFALWADNSSRYEYLAQIRWRLQLDFDTLPSPIKHVQYFPNDLFDISEEETFVDCGAYDGDSLHNFLLIKPFFSGTYIAIEPDPHNLKSLKNNIAALPKNVQDHVTIIPAALGKHRKTVSFEATGLASAGISVAGSYKVECLPLDEILKDIKPTFIKMDIEGAEFDALAGARSSIEKHMPVLAVSVYHRPDDLWHIPLLIRSFSDKYRFFLRPHNEEGWDLVCYAVPENRLKTGFSEKQRTKKQPFYRQYPHRACAVCGSTPGKLLFRQTFSEMSKGSLLHGYDVVVCDTCGFGFADHIPSQTDFDLHYRDMSKYEHQDQGGKETEYDFSRFLEIADSITPFLPDLKVHLLDIGCATGGLIALFKEKGYSNTIGLDPSPVCSESARKLHGVQVAVGTIYDAGKVLTGGQTFDCVILVGVLEHLADINHAFLQMRKLLVNGGLLFIEVPDATDFTRWPNAPFQEFSTEHINYFSPTSLNNLLHKHGFVTVFNRRTTRNQTADIVMPVVTAMFRKKNLDQSSVIVGERETEENLKNYILKSQKTENAIQHVIDGIVRHAKPIIVWGVGTQTLRLLSTTGLPQANIRAFVDSNPRYHGKRLNGIPILAPHDLHNRTETIVISSLVFQSAIERQIRNDLKLGNDIIKLYTI